MNEDFLKIRELYLLNNEDMIKINGGGNLWRRFGEICRNVEDFFMGLAIASSESYHLGMM